ncbi:MAG: hypothetical protein NTW02_00960 [Cyanobium sp. LacPavin_0920_WC12_MAG_62_9]|nr:hypothetical protein [Cyanobium sp. LacPavin_0920_WC12_MAG_62_9]
MSRQTLLDQQEGSTTFLYNFIVMAHMSYRFQIKDSCQKLARPQIRRAQMITPVHFELVKVNNLRIKLHLKSSRFFLAAAIFFLIIPNKVRGQQQQLTDGGMKFTTKSRPVLGFSQESATGSTTGGFLQIENTDFSKGSKSSQLNTELNPIGADGVVLRSGNPEDWKILDGNGMPVPNGNSRKYYGKLKDEKSFVSNDLTNLINNLGSGQIKLSSPTSNGQEVLTQEAKTLITILNANKKSNAKPFLNGNTIIQSTILPVQTGLTNPYWHKGLEVIPTIRCH